MVTPEENYRVKERAENDVKRCGSIKDAIKFLEAELEEYESLWSSYSCESLGHAITCTRYKISFLKQHVNEQKDGKL